MSRFLLAWELGGGLGHVSHLVPIAHALRAAGHYPVLALRDLRTLGSIDPGAEIPVFQAPFCIHNYENLAEPPLNYAEMLMRFGFLDFNMLAGQVRAWRDLARDTAADLILAQHAPSAILAARTMGLRCAALGNGFTFPPAVSPTPNMRPWMQVPLERLVASDRLVLDVINRVLDKFAVAPLAHLHELFAIDDIMLTDFRELDQYTRPAADHARITVCGPISGGGEHGVSPRWPVTAHAGGKRIFAYLKPSYPHIAAILQTLANSGHACLIYGMGAGGTAVVPRASNLCYSTQLIDVAQAGGECDIGICHAGGLTAALLQHGRPLLLLPMQLEQFLLGLRVAECGAGLVVNPEEKQPGFAAALQRLLSEPVFARQAAGFAARYGDWSPDRILGNVVARLASAANGVRMPSTG